MKAAGLRARLPRSPATQKERRAAALGGRQPLPLGVWLPAQTSGEGERADSTYLTSAGATAFLVTKMSLSRPTGSIQAAFTNQSDIRGILVESSHEPKILPFSLCDNLRRVCVPYAAR